ncbi:MAG: hypothetical protein CJBNEKGG_01637 [Prosthecobacter sp.]|nr:hypothetical protein [Prosthecobacter sp.]
MKKSTSFALTNLLLAFTAVSAFAQAPSITSGPQDPKGRQNPIVEDGHPLCELNLSVTATGAEPLTYTWKRGTTVVGTNSPTLQITPSTLALVGNYTCTVSNANGTVVSPVSKVTVVNISDKIFMAAVGQTSATVTVSAAAPTGTTLAYRWYRRLTGGGEERLTSVHAAKFGGVNTKTLTVKNVTEADASFYFCKVMANGYSMNSGDCRLVVLPAPASKLVLAGGSTDLEIMPVGASPSIISQMTYQWKKGVNVIGGATGKILSLTNVTTADVADYTCVVTLPGLAAVTSPKARVDVVDNSEVVYLSKLAQKSAKMKVVVSAAIGRTFQWFNSLDQPLANGAHFAGVTTDTLEVKNVLLTDAGAYYCRVTSYGIPVDSGVRRLIVAPPPDSKLVRLGDPFSLEFVPAGSTPSVTSKFTYQWKKMATVLVGETNTTYNGPASTALADSGKYSCVLTYTPDVGLPLKIESNPALVSVVDPAATTLLIAEGKGSSFKTVTKGDGLSFQWFFNGSLSPLTVSPNYADVNKSTVKIVAPTLLQGGTYVCRVSAFGQSIDSNPNRLVVASRPANVLIDAGDELNLTVLTSGEASAGDLSYQWFKGTASLPGETLASYVVPVAQIADAAKYKCLVTYTGGLAVTPLATDVSVVDRSAASLLGLAGSKVTLGVTTKGSGLSFKWYRGNDTVAIAETPGKYKGTTKDKLEISALENADSGDYRCEVTAFGRLVQIGFRTLEIVTTPAHQLIATGAPVTLEAATTGTITPLSYQWKKGTAVLGGETGPELNIASAALTNAGEYSCVVTIPGGMSLTTGKAAVSVASLASFNVNVADAADAKIKVPAVGGKASVLGFAWSRLDGATKTPLVEGAKHVGVTKQEVKVTGCGAADAGTYVCDITMAGTATTLTTSPISLSVVLPYMSGNFTALLDRTSLLGADNGGRVDLTVATTGAITGKVYLGAEVLPFTGAIAGTDPTPGTASALIPVTRVGGNLTLGFTLGSDNLLVDGTLSNGTDTINFNGWRNTFLATSSAASYAGLYNLGLGLPVGSSAIGDVDIPQGSCFASFTVSTKGEFSMAGKTADGQGITSAGFVGPSGQGLLFDVLYDAVGPASILGSFTIDSKGNPTPSDNTLAGTASWNRPFDANLLQRTYKAGFEPVALAVEGSFYAAPVAPLVFLDLTASTTADNARLLFSGGNIESASTTTLNALTPRTFRVGPLSAITVPAAGLPAMVKLSVTALKGEFKGDFVLKDGTVDRPKTSYEGRVYKKGANLVGAGFFLHDRGAAFNILSGAVFMEKLP